MPAIGIDLWRLALIGIGAILVWRLSGVLLLLFFAVLIATVLRGVSDTLAATTRAPPWLSLGLVVVLLLVAGSAIVDWIGPAIGGQASDLASRLTSQLHYFRSVYGNTVIGHALARGLNNRAGMESFMTGHAFDIATFTFGTIADMVAVLVIAIYLAAAPDLYVNGAVSLGPPAHRPLALRVLDETGRNLRRWLLGQLADMVVVGGLSAIGLDLLGVPVPFALATLAGLLTIVPYIGAITAGWWR